MYQLISALAKSSVAGARWLSVDIAQVTLADIFSQYEFVYATLSNPLYIGTRTLDLNQMRLVNDGSSQTFSDYLTGLADGSLPVTNQSYNVSTNYAIYSDAFKAHYSIEPISPLGHIDSSILNVDRHWLSMTRANTDIDLFFKSCLVTVDGFIHRTDSDGLRVYVIDGMKSARKSKHNTVGITSFRSLGELTFVDIKESMIHRRYPDTPYSSRMYIDLGQVYSGTPMLVLGGYLHVMDEDTFSRISDTIFCINFQNFPLRERYFESVETLDFTTLGLDHQLSNPDRIDDAELHSDAVLTKYATLSQSFIVFLSNDSIFTSKETLAPTLLANNYTSYTEPKYPMRVGYGKLSDYWSVYEDKQWAVKVNDGVRANYEFNTTFESNIVCIDNARTPDNPITYSRAEYLSIGADSLVITNN